jgi:hypothetical protein
MLARILAAMVVGTDGAVGPLSNPRKSGRRAARAAADASPTPAALVQLRVTAPEVQVILRALRTTTTGVAEARRLADVLAEEAALLRRAPTRPAIASGPPSHLLRDLEAIH